MELPQKLEVILEKQAQIVYAVTQHRQAFHAHAECKTAIGLAIDIDRLKHFGMDHAAAHDLKPARLAAHAATFTIAHHALDIDFCGRLGKRKI